MISVIIPTLNEEATLQATLDSVAANQADYEVIVVDAGSSDKTAEIAHGAGARLLVSPRRHRAAQMNFGAKEAKGEILFFLHADTRIPTAALKRIEQALARADMVGGGFRRYFDSKSLFLRASCWVAGIRCRVSGLFLGDQGIFIRRSLFEKLGGFRELDFFEDVDLCRRMKEFGRVATLGPPVLSSARRFERFGPVATTFTDLSLSLRYIKGEDPNGLAAELRGEFTSGEKISAIIPTLNEEESLPRLLSQVCGKVEEVIVVDGGSSDGTVEAARHFPVKVILSARGRAFQMNTGASAASGDLLWFLHADTQLPSNWRGQMASALRKPSVIGGGFRVVIDASGIGYRFLDLWGRLRTGIQGSFYGDQGIFVRRGFFESLGGFDDRPVLEDLDFSTRMSRRARVKILAGPIKTSARRWQSQGWWSTVLQHCRYAVSYLFSPKAGSAAVLIVMAKAPVPGQVKTRLIPALNPEQAAQIAERLLRETAVLVHQVEGIRPVIAVSPPEGMERVKEVLSFPARLIPQPEGDLGIRLTRLFQETFDSGAQAVLVLGADHPNLPQEYLAQAVAELRKRGDRVVFGPTEDGGYYLVGMKRPHPELFAGITWSTSEVLRQTLGKAKTSGVSVKLLPSWYDLDRPEDLARLAVVT